jgi:adenosylcobinamide-GDP ribazoletransferase
MRFRILQLIPEQVDSGTFYFPFVGMLVGSVLVVVNRLLEPYLESEVLSATLVALLALITGGIHYQGLKQTLESRSASPLISDRVYGFLAIFFVVLLKVRALEVIGEARSLALLLSPVFARWGLIIFLYGSADLSEGAARPVAGAVKIRHLISATVLTLSLAAFLIGRTALWIGLSVSLLALFSRTLCWRRDKIRYENFGAVIEGSETLALVFFSTL